MSRTNRRSFLKMAAIGIGTLVGICSTAALAQRGRQYQGLDFSGWEVVVGDGIYTAPGEPPVSQNDIATTNYGSYTELTANIQKRRIMAHNITFKRIEDSTAFDFIHTCGYKFKLPYLPSTSSIDLNAQTLEGGIFIWDGSKTRLDYGAGFQWLLNPYVTDKFGDIQSWTEQNGGTWKTVGSLIPDTSWHEVKLLLDCQRQTTSLTIDGNDYPSFFTRTPKPSTWGTETAGRFQAEIISIDPGEQESGALHKADFRDWTWNWEPYRVFLPIITRY